MLQPDMQRLTHIRDYCDEIQKTILRYGRDFDIFNEDADYQRSISFCILQIGELSCRTSSAKPRRAVSSGAPSRGCEIWSRTAMGV